MLPILVVEDNQMNQHLIVRQLARIGVTDVVLQADGVDALQWLQENRCRLVLADCQMPRMDGYELARRIREAESGTSEHLPIVAMTASVLDEDRKRCLRSGMDGHISKPLQLDTLRVALQPWLS